MDFDEIKQLVEEHVKLITISKKSLGEAVERAGDFLVISAVLTDFKRELEIDKSKLTTLLEAHFSRALKSAEGKNVTDRKASVAEDEDYTDIREKVDEIDAAISWSKTYMKIFENSHILYRGQARD